MPRILILPDAEHLRDGVGAEILYAESVSSSDLDDLYISEGILERLEFAVRGR